ncbi:hypothetical protein DW072_09705, partial [Bifidobacterium adolescentis]
MNQATRHMTPDAWLGVPLQLAIRDLTRHMTPDAWLGVPLQLAIRDLAVVTDTPAPCPSGRPPRHGRR